MAPIPLDLLPGVREKTKTSRFDQSPDDPVAGFCKKARTTSCMDPLPVSSKRKKPSRFDQKPSRFDQKPLGEYGFDIVAKLFKEDEARRGPVAGVAKRPPSPSIDWIRERIHDPNLLAYFGEDHQARVKEMEDYREKKFGRSVRPHPDYAPHCQKGGILVNPNHVHSIPDAPDSAQRRLEGKGLPVFGIVLRDGVLVAAHHSKPGSAFLENLIDIRPGMIAAITGGGVDDCRKLLEDVQMQCRAIESLEQREIYAEEVIKLMLDTLAGRCEMGLIAGWDNTLDLPTLYRVDGSGALIKGEILASGSAFRRLYGFTNLPDRISSMKRNIQQGTYEKTILIANCMHGVLDDPSQYEKYSTWSAWSVHEAAKCAQKAMCWVGINAKDGGDFASVYFVGRHKVDGLIHDIPVGEFVRKYYPHGPWRKVADCLI